MTREEVLRRLKSFERPLRLEGIRALYLFGSVARGEAGPDSDVDLLFDLGDAPHFSLLDQADIQVRLSDALGLNVDFVPRSALRPRVRERVEPEMVRVF
ncbi:MULTISPECIES: nucleotidyltransferase family protein [Sphingomonas]|jgi:predicted nucleotidyltransferase|nr:MULTISPECIES: nucleotidyltransferase domain-containing protein [Sphingomonas]MBA2918538.1 nucleotidyltransferase domain-containing protein [Sphingomonas sp. CGMCC 1.13658]